MKRPRDTRSKWGPRAALITSGIALAAAAWMVKSVSDQEDGAALRPRAAVQGAAQVAVLKGAKAVAKNH